MKKKELGQFYTTNYEYILQNFKIPDNVKNIIEPFAGNGDLIKFLDTIPECYDIEPKQDFIIKRDTLLNPPDYNNKFIITNPPYLARNKNKCKEIYDKYNQNDLYKCFIYQLIHNDCIGGILIVPLNFWCSIRKSDINLRKMFLQRYDIILLNIFEEKIFDDTTYNICSFQFEKSNNNKQINCTIYPKKINYTFYLNESNNYSFGGEIYKLPQNKNIKIERLTYKKINSKYKTNIIAKCIDNNINDKIKLYISNELYIDNTENLTARTFATLIIQPEMSSELQEKIVITFNKYLSENRKKYNSLFLTNYRENNSITRKRISFTLLFQIINYITNKLLNNK